MARNRKRGKAPSIEGEGMESPSKEMTSKSNSGQARPGSRNSSKYYNTTVLTPKSMKLPTGMVTLPSGRRYISYEWSDPYATNTFNTSLIGIEDGAAEFDGLWSGPVLTSDESMLSAYVGDLYNQLYNRAAALGLSVTGYQSATAAANLEVYLSNYVSVYSCLRGLQALMQVAGLNAACDYVAAGLLANKTAIEARIARLEGFPIPPKIRELTDKMCGVWLPDRAGDVPYFSFTTAGGGNGYDPGSTTDVATLMSNCDTMITDMTSLGTVDSANIIRVLGFLYGKPAPFGDKPLHQNTQEYFMHLTRGFSVFNSTGSTIFDAPTVGCVSGTNLIPTYVWGDPSTVDPQWFTLFRPTAYWQGNGAAIAATGPRGVFSSLPATGQGTRIIGYENRTAGVYSAAESFAGPATIGLGSISATTWLWAMTAELNTSTPNQMAAEERLLTGYTRYYVDTADWIDNTIRLYQQVFIDGIVGPTRP